jgi:FRG domain-containing protein
MYGEAPWVWRGQAKEGFNLEPGIHTRMRLAGMELNDANVDVATRALLAATRDAQLDRHGEIKLPDVALLAMIQHHGAATPLLDVSLDPIVALYMAVVSPNPEDDIHDGVLFAIRRPSKVIAPFDARAFADISPTLPQEEVALYTAPDVSDRLRIQRGHFLIGRVSTVDPRVTIPLRIEAKRTPLAGAWIYRRMKARGKKGAPFAATTDVATFKVTSRFKQKLREWLEERTGMTKDFVYPTVWHQPHLDRFSVSQGRTAPLVPR